MRLRNILAAILLLTVTVCAGSIRVSAASEETVVYVTIANGTVLLAQEAVSVTDADSDGILTINDALFCAHEAKYDGGAAAGYGYYTSDFGVSLSRLWGVDNGSGYGYYLNNASATGLTDPVSDGDYVNAFVYTDMTTWSDTYCFFDVNTVYVSVGESVALTLFAAGFDDEWNPVTLPVAGASITLNGADTGVVTDQYGQAVITPDESGVISAVSSSRILVPPVCMATVAGGSPSAAIPVAAAAVILIAVSSVAVMRSRKKSRDTK